MADDSNVHQVYVGGISWDATEADLRELFSEVGEVVAVKVRVSYGQTARRGKGNVPALGYLLLIVRKWEKGRNMSQFHRLDRSFFLNCEKVLTLYVRACTSTRVE